MHYESLMHISQPLTPAHHNKVSSHTTFWGLLPSLHWVHFALEYAHLTILAKLCVNFLHAWHYHSPSWLKAPWVRVLCSAYFFMPTIKEVPGLSVKWGWVCWSLRTPSIIKFILDFWTIVFHLAIYFQEKCVMLYYAENNMHYTLFVLFQ